MTNYDLIRQVHGVDVQIALTETDKWVREARETYYPRDKRCAAIGRALRRKAAGINQTEYEVLRDWPERGVAVTRNWSLALVFAPEVCRLPVRQHAAVAKLLDHGHLALYKPSRERENCFCIIARTAYGSSLIARRPAHVDAT